MPIDLAAVDTELVTLLLAMFAAIATALVAAGVPVWDAPSVPAPRTRRVAVARTGARAPRPPQVLTGPVHIRRADVAVRSAALAPLAGVSGPRSGRLSVAAQVDRLAAIVAADVARAETASRLHASASQQLDLAGYALQSLLDELSDVIPALRPTPVRTPPSITRTPVRAWPVALAA